MKIKNHKIQLVVGDWSDDGHGKTRSFLISSNLSEKEINAAYANAKNILGFDFTEVIATDDRKILKIHYEKLEKYGTFDLYDVYNDGKAKCCNSEDYVNLYLAFIKAGNHTFKWKFVKDKFETINIGGYGLFM